MFSPCILILLWISMNDLLTALNLHAYITTIMGQMSICYYICLIIVVTFSLWNSFANITTIMGQ